MAKLIITNGDSAAGLLRAAGLVGDATLLPWRDALHDGPVPLTESDAELDAIRSRYLAAAHGANIAETESIFAERRAIVDDHNAFEEIEIWLEHDLYDQLQLLQILDRLGQEDRTDGVSLIQADDHLGAQSPGTIGRFADRARAIGADDLRVARRMWTGYRAPTPQPFAAGRDQDMSTFPCLGPAITRALEELPGATDGLTRTQRTALRLIDEGQRHPGRLFGAVQETEEAAFMGDASFFVAIEDLIHGPRPALTGPEMRYRDLAESEVGEAARTAFFETPLALTAFGREVLAGRADFAGTNPIDRWWGGTHLASGTLWRWDAHGRDVVRS